MKLKYQIFLALSLSTLAMSCATSIPYTNEESCAVDNMKYDHLEKHQLVSVVRTPNEHTPIVRDYEQTVLKCDQPASVTEKQRVQNLRAELDPKIQFNHSLWKNQADYDKALAESNAIANNQSHHSMQATFPKDE